MFSHTECTKRNFISLVIMAFVKANRLFGARARQNPPRTDNAISLFRKSSKILLIHCKEKRHKSVSVWKKRQRSNFLSSRVRSHFSPRGKDVSKDIEQLRINGMDEAYRKLFRLKPSLHRYTEGWKTAEWLKIFSE